MAWVTVENSSYIKAYKYDEDTQELQVEFHYGAEYVHYDVPATAVTAFADSESKGKHYNQFIKGVYRYSKLTA